MYEGLETTIKETHAKLRGKRGIAVTSLPRQLPLTQLSVRDMHELGTGRGKGKTRPKGGSVHQKKLETPAKDKHDTQAHSTSCTLVRDGAMFTRVICHELNFGCTSSSEEPEHATLAAIAPLLVSSG